MEEERCWRTAVGGALLEDRCWRTAVRYLLAVVGGVGQHGGDVEHDLVESAGGQKVGGWGGQRGGSDPRQRWEGGRGVGNGRL